MRCKGTQLFVCLFVHAVLSADASLAPAPVIPIDLRDDAYSNTVPAGTLLFFNLRVLENDTPDSLKLIGVEQIGATKGSIDVEASKKLLVYQLDSKGLTAGTTFTDRFRCGGMGSEVM